MTRIESEACHKRLECRKNGDIGEFEYLTPGVERGDGNGLSCPVHCVSLKELTAFGSGPSGLVPELSLVSQIYLRLHTREVHSLKSGNAHFRFAFARLSSVHPAPPAD